MKTLIATCFAISLAIVIFGYGVSACIACETFSLKHPYCSELSKFGSFYGTNLRGNLFSGFLSLGGLLLSLKTFVVITMKTNVYDSDVYKKNWHDQQKISPGGRLYDPLKELSSILYLSILTTLATAVLQITLGLWESLLVAMACIWSAIFSTTLLVASLVLMKRNLDVWFGYLNDEP